LTSAPQQLVLDLGHRPALGAEDLIVGNSNAAAVAMVDRWPEWPNPVVICCGPAGAGKSHLVNVWRLRSQAVVASAAAAHEPDVLAIAAAKAGAIEDIDRGIADEKALFHLLNLVREQGGHLLMTARTPPGEWNITLPDLRSRLRACPVVAIAPPDDGLIAAVLVKLLTDRQLPATPAGVTYLARHMERSMAAALRLVEEIDQALWRQPKRELTRDFARAVLARVGGEDAPE
jgi:chromosomal replication initiation ATPase DnaA